MAPRQRVDAISCSNQSAAYYKQKRDKFDIAKLNKGNYADNSLGLQKMMKKQWDLSGGLGLFAFSADANVNQILCSSRN